MYRIDLDSPARVIPCSFVASARVPGKTLCVNENGHTIVVLPNGLERANDEPPGDDWDSPYTQATVVDGFLVYRSAAGPSAPTPPEVLGVPRAYRMLGA